MAGESITDQVKPQKIEPKDGDEKANPVERFVITKGPPKILSRYLSNPRASCHDFCKYGIQHIIEAKPWITAQKRVTTRERKTKVPEETVTSSAGTKKSGSSSKPSLTSKIERPKFPVDIKEVTNEKPVTSEKNSPTFEGKDVSMEHTNSDLSQARSEPSSVAVQQERSKSQTNRKIVKNKSPFGSSSRKESGSRSIETMTSLVGGMKKSMPPSIPLSSSKHNVKKTSSLSTETAKNLKGVSSKNHENVEEVKPELPGNDNLPDKVLHVTEPTSANLSEEPTVACDANKMSSPSPSSIGDKSLKLTSKKTGKSGVSASSRKGLRHAGRGIHPTVSVAPSHLSSGNKGKRNMQHKMCSASRSPSSSSSSSNSSSNSSLGKQHDATSKLNKTGHKQSASASCISSSNPSRAKQNGATSKSNKTGHGYHGENGKVGYKIRPKMSTKVGAANNVIPTRKLAFRRGKVIELQPQSNNIPRRLKFRPARRLGDDFQKDIYGTRKRTITSKVDGGGELNVANIKSEKVVTKLQIVEGSKKRSVGRKVGGDRSKIDGSKSGSEKVVLRHQNVEGKKENPRLYNNVIEETASMLAELRKSKVKALVGAFETVISLDSPREASPSEVSTAC